MSRSNPMSLKHPATKWIEYHGGGEKGGTFSYYDKEKVNEDGSRGANVSLGAKFSFMFLDQTYSVTGWNEPSHSGVYANEVKDISNGIFTVKAFKGQDSHVGNWTSIKDRVKSMGGKFTCNIYIAIKTKQGLELSVVQLKGAAFAKWNKFKKNSGDKALEIGAVKIASHLDGVKGAVKFKTPIFELIPEVTAESNNSAIELDKQLQEFLASKIVTPTTPTVEEVATPPVQIQEEPRTSLKPERTEMGVVDMDENELEPVQQEFSSFDDFDDDTEELPF
tara:strand:- start:20883 stop:21716 length:834 start_codon:yes stop_codon:yes gene_type:complete